MPGASSTPVLKMRTSADSSQPETASLESCCSASSAHGTARSDAQRLGCLLVLPPQNSNVIWDSVEGASLSPAPKMRTSADSSQPERASLESCCSASSAHGTARTEAQRLGCLLVLPPQSSNVSWEWGLSMPGASGSPSTKMRTSADSTQPEISSLEC